MKVRGPDGRTVTLDALRQIASTIGGELELLDASGRVFGRLHDLRVNGRREVHADFEMGDRTAAQVQALMRGARVRLASGGPRDLERLQ